MEACCSGRAVEQCLVKNARIFDVAMPLPSVKASNDAAGADRNSTGRRKAVTIALVSPDRKKIAARLSLSSNAAV